MSFAWRKAYFIGVFGVGALLLECVFVGAQPPAEGKPVLRVVQEVELPGSAVRFDYQSLDPNEERWYIAHMNAGQLVVFDTSKRQVIANLDGFKRVHGVISVPELDRVYDSATGEYQVAMVDRGSLKTIARAGTIRYSDGLAFAPKVKRVFVSDEHGDADAVIDAGNNTFLKTSPWRVVLGTRPATRGGAASW